MKKFAEKVTALACTAAIAASLCGSAAAEKEADIVVTVSTEENRKPVSQWLFGVNIGVEDKVSAKSIRVGGNRMTAYNWENNYSNAGSDWYNNSDDYMVRDLLNEYKLTPGAVALNLSDTAAKNSIPYKLMTLQLQGYVAADGNGSVQDGDEAPSDRWKTVELRKGSDFTLTPDTDDGSVYMDEYLNYLINYIGKSESEKGINAYALDNEPALWSGTHSKIQTEPLTCEELVNKSAELAALIKEFDSGADVYGPSLYGYYAYVCLQDAPDWKTIQKDNGYAWFIDYYLDAMSKKSTQAGKRLLDVLDLHYYTEAKGRCGKRSCNHYDNDDCIKARLNSYRSLFDPSYKERSWITDSGAEFFPLLPTLKSSIDKYYPDTKLAFTEYDFGGGDHISGAIAEVDALGTFAENDVYMATIWADASKCAYQMSAINLFTDYDGKNNGFGDTLVSAKTNDIELSSAYAAVNDGDDSSLRIIVTNKSIHEPSTAQININSKTQFTTLKAYALTGETSEITALDNFGTLDGNVITCTIPALSVVEFVAATDKAVIAEEVQEGEKAETDALPYIITAAAAAVTAIIIAIFFVRRKIKKQSTIGVNNR